MRLVSNAPVPSDTYDTFGNTISVKDGNGNIITNPNNIGIINPYRYRSYRYDYESGLYYLNSRYYVPEWGRFLNGDNYGGQVGTILSHNIYAYCGNNPINRSDPSGLFWKELFETFMQTVQGWTPAYAGEASFSLADGPFPFGDIIAGVLMAGTTVGALGYSAYKVATMPKVASKDKAEAIPKTPPKLAQYWAVEGNPKPLGQNNAADELTYSQARLRIAQGGNVMCISQNAAYALVRSYPGKVLHKAHHNGAPGFYPHYHLNKTTSAPHIWFYGYVRIEHY